jgi:acyl dehydratase
MSLPISLAFCVQEGEAPKQQETAAASQPLDTWTLPENTGRAYAALDGDISPMHLYKATAMLMGFPSPVANVHFLAARTEATIDTTVGELGMPPTYSLAGVRLDQSWRSSSTCPEMLHNLHAAAAYATVQRSA